MIATLGERLRACGLDPAEILAHRIALHPADADESYRTTADLVRTGHVLIYERLQNGPVFGQTALIASFTQTSDGAHFVGLRRLVARRPGIAPGDIVYDPEIAHLLHNFISRATEPMFYDAFDDERGEPLHGSSVCWPQGAPDTLPADDARLLCLAELRS